MQTFIVWNGVWNEMLSIMNRKQAEEINGMPLDNKGIAFFKIYGIFILLLLLFEVFYMWNFI